MIQVVTLTERLIAGVQIQTTCQDGAAIPAIQKLWQRVLQEKLLELIPNKVSNHLYSAYFYHSPATISQYTYVIGYEVTNIDNIPASFKTFTLPAGTYLYTQATGKAPEIVQQTWPKIWQKSKEDKLPFAYTVDFEVYTQGDYLGSDKQEITVKIYSSIKTPE